MPAPEKIKILVTGFGPFPGVHSNPSEKLLGWIEEQHVWPMSKVRLKTALIPTNWSAVEQFSSHTLAELDPDIVLHFGTQETGIQCGDTSATLTGNTVSGQAIEGSGSINTVGCR